MCIFCSRLEHFCHRQGKRKYLEPSVGAKLQLYRFSSHSRNKIRSLPVNSRFLFTLRPLLSEPCTSCSCCTGSGLLLWWHRNCSKQGGGFSDRILPGILLRVPNFWWRAHCLLRSWLSWAHYPHRMGLNQERIAVHSFSRLSCCAFGAHKNWPTGNPQWELDQTVCTHSSNCSYCWSLRLDSVWWQ